MSFTSYEAKEIFHACFVLQIQFLFTINNIFFATHYDDLPVMCILKELWFVNRLLPLLAFWLNLLLWAVPLEVDAGPWCLFGAGVRSLHV